MTEEPRSRRLVRWMALPLCLFAIGGAATVSGTTPVKVQEVLEAEPSRLNGIMQILAVLENRTADREVLVRAADKLTALPQEELRLLSSLCDKIRLEGDTPVAEMAFALITAMIVLS